MVTIRHEEQKINIGLRSIPATHPKDESVFHFLSGFVKDFADVN